MTTPTQEALAALKRLSSVFYNKPPPGFAEDLATIRAALRDAERYQWLRGHFRWAQDSFRELWFDATLARTEEITAAETELDAAIDAARAAEGG